MTAHLICLILTGTAAFAVEPRSEYVPLLTGNEWLYREAATGKTFRMRIGEIAYYDNHVYHKLIGYIDTPLWVRYEGEALVYRDIDNDRDLALIPLERPTGATGGQVSVYRPCEGAAHVSPDLVTYEGPVGLYRSALQVLYHAPRCAQSATEELFLDSIGMLRRVVTTPAGSRQFDLVWARAGAVQVEPDPGTTFRVSTRTVNSEDVSILVTVRLALRAALPLHMRKPAAQDFDVVLRTVAGEEIWQWSDGQAFPPGFESVAAAGVVEFSIAVPRKPGGRELATGHYVVEAWLTAGLDRPLFSGATPVEYHEAAQSGRQF